ncbi:MAG: hypothetical protein AB1730_25720 [Myxococcota bacterium]
MKKIVAVAALAATLVGCAHGQDVKANANAGFAPEAMRLWSRPQEFGYTLGERLQGEASYNCVLMFICWGAEGGGDIFGSISNAIGALSPFRFGGASVKEADPLVNAAAANAVLSAPTETDGIYVLNHETDSFNIFLYSRRSARVIGKAMRLHPIGEVSQERADKERFLRAMSGGGSVIQMPSSFGEVR